MKNFYLKLTIFSSWPSLCGSPQNTLRTLRKIRSLGELGDLCGN